MTRPIEVRLNGVDARMWTSDPHNVADCILVIDAEALAKALAPKAAKNKSKVSRMAKGAITLRVVNVKAAQS